MAGACSIALTIVMIGEFGLVSNWFHVALPVVIALTMIFLIFTALVVLWITVAVKLLGSPVDLEYEGEAFNLDSLFRTAKVCFIGHGYSLLLCVALWLVIIKADGWYSISTVYPCLPFIVLGAVHVLLAFMFKAPELDAGRSSFIGVSMLGHSVMLILKLDNHLKSSLPWSVVFIPSWFTYVGVLAVCALQGAFMVRRALSQADMPSERVEAQLLLGMTVWALGFGVSQVLVTLHLDGDFTWTHWQLALVPALVGWVVLFLCAATHVSKFFEDIVYTFLDAFGMEVERDEDDPKAPLLLMPGDGLPQPNWH